MIEMLSLQTSLLQTLGWTLLHSSWQGALIAVILFLVLLFAKRSQVRYVISCAALLLMLLTPVVTFGILFDKPTLSTETDVVTDITPKNEPSDVAEGVNVNTLQTLPREGQPHGVAPKRAWTDERFWRQHLTNYLPYLVVVWLLGVVLLSLRLLLQWLYAERFKRRHTKHASADVQHLVRVLALRLCVSRPVQLLESSLVDAPTVIGFLKPVILLPTSAVTGLTMQQLESLLAHELAHIRRHDYLVNILQSVIETLLFYHPAVWWVSQRVRVEREHCCDDVAVGVSGSAVVYARALERLESLRQQPNLAMAASGISLVKRIRRLVAKPTTRTRFSASWLISFSTLTVLMVGIGFWIYPQLTQAQTAPTSFQVFDRNGEELTEATAPHAFGMIKDELVNKLGAGILEQNLSIYSTIDLQAQQAANEASLSAEMPPGAQMAVVGVDPSTGGILAMVGEYLKQGQEVGELNRAAQSHRQLGHSFTPLVYATAFERAGFTQATVLNDEPTAFKQPGQADYKPANHDNTFMGLMTLRKSLDISRNIPAIKLMESVTPEAIVTKAQELGYENVQPFWSTALGSFEATPLQHAAAFGSFANGGVYIEPHIIDRVENAAGKVLFETTPVEKQVWSEQTAYLTLDLMHGNAVDPGAFSLRAAIDRRYVAGKTGTSNEQRDIWFVGMTPGMVATVWIGYDDNSHIPQRIVSSSVREDGRVTSSRQPVYIWKDFVEGASAGKPIEEYPVPEGITFKNIDLTTGGEGSTKAAFLVQADESMMQPDVESSRMEAGLESKEMFTMPFDNPQIYSEFGRMGSHLSLRAKNVEAPVKAA
jgi:beta-lactamase regulating signal transducer with metallopeptidase domain